MQLLIKLLPQILSIAGIDRSHLQIGRLGGLYNENYKLSGSGASVVVRIAGAGTDAFVNHKNEAENARAAAAAGIGPEVLYSDERRGLIVTRFVEGGRPLDVESARSAANLVRIARMVRALHSKSRPFAGRFDPFRQLDRYGAIVHARGHSLPDGFLEAAGRLGDARMLMASRVPAFVPCHCDLLPENILDDGRRLYIIDYEFSGNCDPLWDLGDFSGEAELDEPRENALLRSYFDDAVPLGVHAILTVYKAFSLLLAAGWTRAQIACGHGSEMFETYGAVRLARCWDVLESSSLPPPGESFAIWSADRCERVKSA